MRNMSIGIACVSLVTLFIVPAQAGEERDCVQEPHHPAQWPTRGRRR